MQCEIHKRDCYTCHIQPRDESTRFANVIRAQIIVRLSRSLFVERASYVKRTDSDGTKEKF